MLTRPTLETIYNRMKINAETRLTEKEGRTIILKTYSTINILIMVFACSIHLCYGVLVWLAEQLFADTAEYEYLLKLGIPKGINPKSAAFASGTVTIYGSSGGQLPPYQTAVDENGNTYTLQNDYTHIFAGISSVEVDIIADEVGTTGNIDTNLTLQQSLYNVTDTLVNYNGFTGGIDVETTEEYRARVVQFQQNRPQGGKDADYVRWATEVSGCVNAWVIPKISGAGSVGVICAGANNIPVDAAILENVYNNIIENYPLGIVLRVQSIVNSVLRYDIAINPNTEVYQNAITSNFETLLSDETTTNNTVLISKQRTAISDTGVDDYEILNTYIDDILFVNGDIVTTDYTRLQLGLINWSLKT